MANSMTLPLLSVEKWEESAWHIYDLEWPGNESVALLGQSEALVEHPYYNDVYTGWIMYKFAALPSNITIVSAKVNFVAQDTDPPVSYTLQLMHRLSASYRAYTIATSPNVPTTTVSFGSTSWYTQVGGPFYYEYEIDVTSALKLLSAGQTPYLYKAQVVRDDDDYRSVYDRLEAPPMPTGKTFTPIGLTIVYNYTYTTCGAPTAATVLPTTCESDPTLTWSGATRGTDNAIVGYDIQAAGSSDGSTWGTWFGIGSISTTASSGTTTVGAPPIRGNYRKYRIRTKGSAGSTYYSAWKETNAVRLNSDPLAPTTATATPALYESGGITVAWGGATDVDNNIVSYEIQRAASADGSTWGDWVNVSTSATGGSRVNSPTITRGQYVKYRIRAKDVYGLTSAYKETGIVRRNSVPYAPAINYPSAGKITYNSYPRFLMTVSYEPDEQAQTISADGYTVSSGGPYLYGKKLLLRRAASASPGTVQAVVIPSDAYGVAGASTSRSTTYASPAWTNYTLSAGGTRIYAAHMNEIRAAVDVMRSYYGMNAFSWATTITSNVTSLADWADHVEEIRTAIGQLVAFVNAWDSTATIGKITLPTWVPIRGKQPQADVMMQLRSIVTML